jgi:hypothetical protein
MNLNVETRYIHKLYNNSFHNGNSFDIELAVSVEFESEEKTRLCVLKCYCKIYICETLVINHTND